MADFKFKIESSSTGLADRRGFSYLELLVSALTIGILIARLLPAVNFARESARRATCFGNRGQLLLAVQVSDLATGVCNS